MFRALSTAEKLSAVGWLAWGHPSGIKLFSKVVFMKQGRQFGLSAEQKLDVWREREERTPPDGRSNPTVTRHQTTNGGMLFAKSAPDLMQRLPCLPTTPHVEFLLRRKPKLSPLFHKHHL